MKNKILLFLFILGITSSLNTVNGGEKKAKTQIADSVDSTKIFETKIDGLAQRINLLGIEYSWGKITFQQYFGNMDSLWDANRDSLTKYFKYSLEK